MEAVKKEKYICIQEFMVRDLNLKGNELIVYALIYGFSQDDTQFFSGSLNYIADWINSSKTTVRNILKSLCDKGLLIKRDKYINDVKFCEYKASVPAESVLAEPDDCGHEFAAHAKNCYGGVQNSATPHAKNCYGGITESATNNNIYNTNNKLNNKYILSGRPDDIQNSASDSNDIKKKRSKPEPKNHPEEIKQIIDYFNRVCGTSYRSQSEATAKLINARLNEGFTVEDFCRVIDKKYTEWKNNSDYCKYIRPQTLFRPSHFENYLNQKDIAAESAGGITEEQRRLYNSVVIE